MLSTGPSHSTPIPPGRLPEPPGPPTVFEVRTRVADTAAAGRIAAVLVDERLAACTHISGPLQSTYRWQGQVETALEVEVDAVTAADRIDALVERLEVLHPYTVPAVLVTGAHCSRDYARWVIDQTRP